MILDVLLDELIELEADLRAVGVPLILGGGMGLWLRDTFPPSSERSPRYPQRPTSRSTNDLDFILSTRVVTSVDLMHSLRDVLSQRDYRPNPKAKCFQFVREIHFDGSTRVVKVDLLAVKPTKDELQLVKVNGVRIRPKGAKDIHGYITPEAAGTEIGLVLLDLSRARKSALYEVAIPSSLNYLILKLHAFHDRHKIEDEKSNGGRHHAFDIFRVVTDMRESDWESAKLHFSLHGDHEYFQKAASFQQNYFSNSMALGVIRLKENEGYKEHRTEFDAYISDFLGDLSELFTKSE